MALRVRSQNSSHEQASREAAQVRGKTDLWSPKIKSGLNSDNEDNVAQPAAGKRPTTMAQEQTGGDADHAHDATGSTNKLIGMIEIQRA
jgi:hypothetical protein